MHLNENIGDAPLDYVYLYGSFAEEIREQGRFFREARDRAAYVHAAGAFPSHLRKAHSDFLRQIMVLSRGHRRLDGRRADMKIRDDVVEHLELDELPLIRMVRLKVQEGYFIDPRPRIELRRNYWRIYMSRLKFNNDPYDRIVLNRDGSVKAGWGHLQPFGTASDALEP